MDLGLDGLTWALGPIPQHYAPVPYFTLVGWESKNITLVFPSGILPEGEAPLVPRTMALRRRPMVVGILSTPVLKSANCNTVYA